MKITFLSVLKINIPIGWYQIAFLHAYVLSLIRSGCNLKLQVVSVSAFQSTLYQWSQQFVLGSRQQTWQMSRKRSGMGWWLGHYKDVSYLDQNSIWWSWWRAGRGCPHGCHYLLLTSVSSLSSLALRELLHSDSEAPHGYSGSVQYSKMSICYRYRK